MPELDRREASVAMPAVVVINSPRLAARVNHRIVWLVGIATCLSLLAVCALWFDLPVAQFVKSRGLSGELRRLVRLSEAFAWGGTVALIVLAAVLLDPRGWRIAPRLVVCAAGSGILADCCKLLWGRWRPMAAPLDGDVLGTFVTWLPAWRVDLLDLKYGHALQSFPSGHVATAAGLAVALSMLYPRGRWLFVALAVLAAVQRIEAQAHFASDVLAAAALGCLVGVLCEVPGPLSRWLSRLESM